MLLFLPVLAYHMPETHAQECIDLLGAKWSKSHVGVYIALGAHEVQRKQVLFALEIWLSAQQWFIDSFMGGAGIPWLLYLTDRSDEARINLSFFIGQGVDFGGRAITEGAGHTFTGVRVQINLPPDRAGDPNDLYVESVILHELGHALGLGHTSLRDDAMNSGIDASPQNYGLPSTLDLYALYSLSQGGDPWGAVCLPADVGYGLPPWVEKRPDGTVVLAIPSPSYVTAFDGYTNYPLSVFAGESTTFKTTLRNRGYFPIAVVSAAANPDFGGSVGPSEPLPLVIEPLSQRDLTHTVTIPIETGAGTHRVTFHVEVAPLTVEGWSSQTTTSDQTINFEVAQPQMTFVITKPEVTAGTVTIEVPTMSTIPTSGSNATGYEWVIAVVILVLIIIAATFAGAWRDRSKRGRRPKEPEITNVFCTECGAENPTTNEYCGKCGKRLVAMPIHE
jgi:hypothetical protein